MKKFFLFLSMMVFLIFVISCEIDHGLEPVRSYIQGTIEYSGTWPGTPAEVRLVAAKQFPPTNITDLIIGENIKPDAETLDYNFYLNPGVYKLLGVAWRESGGTWDIISICSIYFAGTDSLVPGEIILDSDTSVVRNIDMKINRSRARRVTDSKITGEITFEGTWPDSLSDVRVIASTRGLFPRLPTLLDLSFSNSIPVNSKSATYTISAFPAEYQITGLIFFETGRNLSLADIQYSGSIGGLSAEPYTVQEDSIVHGPDFNIKF